MSFWMVWSQHSLLSAACCLLWKWQIAGAVLSQSDYGAFSSVSSVIRHSKSWRFKVCETVINFWITLWLVWDEPLSMCMLSHWLLKTILDMFFSVFFFKYSLMSLISEAQYNLGAKTLVCLQCFKLQTELSKRNCHETWNTTKNPLLWLFACFNSCHTFL